MIIRLSFDDTFEKKIIFRDLTLGLSLLISGIKACLKVVLLKLREPIVVVLGHTKIFS